MSYLCLRGRVRNFGPIMGCWCQEKGTGRLGEAIVCCCRQLIELWMEVNDRSKLTTEAMEVMISSGKKGGSSGIK